MEQPQSQDQRDRLCPPPPSLWPCPAINKSTPLISTLTASWNRNAALASLERTDRWKLIKKRFLHIRYHNAQEDIWMIFFLYNKVVIIFNFSPGAKISWRLVQKWPRNKTKVAKKTKIDPKTRFFFSKRAQDFELLKQVPESSHQTVFLALCGPFLRELW